MFICEIYLLEMQKLSIRVSDLLITEMHEVDNNTIIGACIAWGPCGVGSYLLGGLDASKRHWQKVLRILSTTWGSDWRHHVRWELTPTTRQNDITGHLSSSLFWRRTEQSPLNRGLSRVHTLICSLHVRGTSTWSLMTRGSSLSLARSGKITPRVWEILASCAETSVAGVTTSERR